MTSRFFKSSVISVLCAAAIALGAATAMAADAAEKTLSKADVEQIVHDYIVSNPQLILTSVDDYQKKSMRARQGDALEKNKDILFKDSSSPEAGNADGDVTVIEFFDYNCHFCKSALPAVQALLEKDKKVRFVFKDFPILGPTSETAAKWALAAQKQKKYYDFYKAMMSNKQPINDELLEKTAKDIGMDIVQAKKDIDGTDILLQIEKNRTLASSLGLNGTPAFIIGDEIIPGAIPLEEMEKSIATQRGKKTAK